MSEHTKEPWKLSKITPLHIESQSIGIASCGGYSSNQIDPDVLLNEQKANARRIVACVNACRKFSLEELDGADLQKDSIDAANEIHHLTQQRDKLLEALKELAGTCALALDGSVQWDAHKNARAIIAEVEASK